jgi:GDPmannose 4,6-dehydratase
MLLYKLMKIAFLTGITGQDGSYLAELLLDKGYIVYGMIRRSSSINTKRIDHIFSNENLKLVYGDLTDSTNITHILANIKTSHLDMTRLEVYNLGAQSHVQVSFELPEYTGQVDAIGTLRLLEAIRSNGLENVTRFYQASTSELYGKSEGHSFNEQTSFYPRSPYGVAKLYGYWIVKNYRESYNMFACSGVLFNHESKRRGHNFVTRKITIGLGKILRGETDRLKMGNIDALRDWGHAKDYVKGMWHILQHSEPVDYVLATGEMHTVREFIEKAFSLRGFDIKWKGTGVEEIGYDSVTGRELIFIDSKYFRPAEVERLLGDATKAKDELGWEPKITFAELVKEMVDADCS